MSYQVLARKWRPGSFREMVGQQHVLRALINALDHDRLHHAYLFTGTRGVGKTTIARILAKCLNCDAGVSSEPCGTCGSCLEISEGRSVDLLEVDAASRTKVEDTRELLDNVQYAPTRSRYKIYLIDEVHMLSNHSFNALLKTLEEPPPHAKFLLATTDPQKLPATVLSRCLQFNLKNMVPEQIAEHLAHILGQENISFESETLGLLARAAAGSMRDALSLTDQAIAFGSGALRETEVRDMLGTVDRGRVLDLVAAVANGSPEKVLQGVDAIAQHAPDFGATLDELISVFHQMTVAQMVPGAVDTTWSEQQRIVELAAELTVDDTQLFYQFAINGRRDLPVAVDPRVALEMTLLRMIAFRPAVVVEDVAGLTSDGPSQTLSGGVPPGKKPEPPAPAPVAAGVATETKPTHDGQTRPSNEGQSHAPAVPQQRHDAIDRGEEDLPSTAGWPEFFESLGLVGITQNIAMHCELVAVEGRTLRFVLDQNNATLFQERQAKALELAISQFLEKDVQVVIGLGSVGSGTPQQRRAQLAIERQRDAERALAEDAVLAALISEFDAELIDGSIRPPQG